VGEPDDEEGGQEAENVDLDPKDFSFDSVERG